MQKNSPEARRRSAARRVAAKQRRQLVDQHSKAVA